MQSIVRLLHILLHKDVRHIKFKCNTYRTMYLASEKRQATNRPLIMSIFLFIACRKKERIQGCKTCILLSASMLKTGFKCALYSTHRVSAHVANLLQFTKHAHSSQICWCKHHSLITTGTLSYQSQITFFLGLSLDFVQLTPWEQNKQDLE